MSPGMNNRFLSSGDCRCNTASLVSEVKAGNDVSLLMAALYKAPRVLELRGAAPAVLSDPVSFSNGSQHPFRSPKP